MRIQLGLNLDRRVFRRGEARFDEAIVGALGFLTVLETRLGLLRQHGGQAERVAQYRHCLQQCLGRKPFYAESFAADDIGTAARLLGWRDHWHLHGWAGTFDPKASPRLRDLATVETLAAKTVDASVGERLAVVLAALDSSNPAIEEVELRDPIAAFPKRWRAVLGRLPITPYEAGTKPVGAGFLGRLQTAVYALDGGREPKPLAWKDDGTVAMVRAETRILGSDWLAQQLEAAAPSTVVIAGADGGLLDDALHAHDRPRTELSESSGFRPALQTLPLVLALVWEPLDVHALLQFLTHPLAPIRRRARKRLAEALAESPGVGGPNWIAAREWIAEQFPDEAGAIADSIDRWLQPQRFDPARGAPTAVLIERAEALATWFRVSLGSDEPIRRVACEAGYVQCCDCVAALRVLSAQGVAELRRQQLDRVVALATAGGSPNPLVEAEVGAVLVTEDPAAVDEPVDRVIWWQLVPPALPRPYPWSLKEQAHLAAAGVELPTVDDLLARQSRGWLRPLLAARQSLTLVLPPAGEEMHPVLAVVRMLVPDLPGCELEDLLTAPARAAGLAVVRQLALPAKRRWWKLPANTPLDLDGPLSYSSLNLFVHNPYQWVLQYPARLSASTILSISDGNQLYGSLVHRVVDRFYRRPDALQCTGKKLEAVFQSIFDQVLAEEGAILGMPGRRADRQRVDAAARLTLQQLQVQMKKAGVVAVEPERDLNAQFSGRALRGQADLVVTNQDGKHAVVDMKWGGWKYRRESLQANGHLQLAIYARMLKGKARAWPDVAYFIIEDGLLMAPDQEFFPHAIAVASGTGESTAGLWARFEKSFAWRVQQIAAGKIEVVLEEIEATHDSAPPGDGLPTEILSPSFNDYLTLAGW